MDDTSWREGEDPAGDGRERREPAGRYRTAEEWEEWLRPERPQGAEAGRRSSRSRATRRRRSSAGATLLAMLLGFFLGPLFPTTIAVTPRLTEAPRVPTAIGVGNGVSVVGGAVFPWLAGSIAQEVGTWTLLPFSAVLSVVLLVVWWRMTRRLAPL